MGAGAAWFLFYFIDPLEQHGVCMIIIIIYYYYYYCTEEEETLSWGFIIPLLAKEFGEVKCL